MAADGPTALDRRGAWIMLAVAVLAWSALAVWLVPWEWSPGGLEPAAASDYLDQAEIARAERYAAFVRPRSDASLALALLVGLLLGFTGRGTRLLQGLTSRLRWWLAVPLAVLTWEAAVRAVSLPLAWQVRGRRLEEGLTQQAASGWWADQALSLLVTWAIATLGVLLVVGCARRWPRRWYVPVGAAALVGSYLVSMAYPAVVEPVFNRFTPLADDRLRTELIDMARRQGVDVGDVLVVDASRRTTTLNAYVSGLGGTRRLVVYDTLLADAPRDEVVAVAAHEVAHVARRDVLVGTTLGAVGAVAAVAALALLGERRGRGGPAWGDASVTWSLLAAASLAAVLVTPVQSSISRAIETRADVDSLQVSRDGEAFERLHVRLARRSLADPTPPAWRQLVWGTHPTVLQRLSLGETS